MPALFSYGNIPTFSLSKFLENYYYDPFELRNLEVRNLEVRNLEVRNLEVRNLVVVVDIKIYKIGKVGAYKAGVK